MKNIFNIEGPLFSFLNKLANIAILNLLWVICCIPIITIGSSTSALLFSAMRLSNNIDDHVFTTFFKVFAKNFRKSTIIWLIMLVAGAIIGGDLYMFYNAIIGSRIFFYISLPVAAIYFFMLLYIFAVLTIYDNSVKNALRNSLYFSITKLPSTLFMCVGIAAIFLLTTSSADFFSKFGLVFWVFFGFAFIAYMCSYFFNNIFKHDFEENEYIDIFFI